MFVLHVELKVKPGSQKAVEDAYAATFSPAIAQQEGFRDVNLLRPAENGGDEYRLSIAFADRASQQHWVATDLHDRVWPQIESQCSAYSVKNYYSV
jgi:heme-degrading monooxygenase HmoA